MTPPSGERSAATLAFGGAEPSAPAAVEAVAPGGPILGGVRPAPARSPARRARQRRRAAQRRSRARMREGSEALLVFLVLLGLTLLLIDVQTGGRAYAIPRSAAAAVLGPLQDGVDDVVDPEQADAELLAENERLQAELAASASASDRARLQELESLLGIAGRAQHRVIGASIVALDADAGNTLTATIDRGSGDGVAEDLAVLAGGGLGGRVLTAGPRSAVVLLAADTRFAVGGQLASSSEIGIVRGTGDADRLTMELLDPLTQVGVGDPVVTAGSPGSRPFPPGVAIGTVVDAGDPTQPRRILQLEPAADLTTLTAVAVSVPPERAASVAKGLPAERGADDAEDAR